MKRFLAIILLLPFLTLIASAGNPITIPVHEPPTDELPERGDGNKGHRMPPAPVFCTIDIEEGTVTSTSPRLDNIDSYEVWSAEGEICLASSSTAEEFTATLSTLASGDYTIRLICPDYYYTGIVIL